jgi:YEATS domain-containing protein 4
MTATTATATDANNNKESNSNNNSNSTRLSQTTACLPIVYGSIAVYLGKKADEFQTHEWTLFVRGPNHEDISPAISKVVFQLHASFAQQVRELTQPPFEVTERGWGEFEAQIRIVWKDPTEKPTVVRDNMCLFSELHYSDMM